MATTAKKKWDPVQDAGTYRPLDISGNDYAGAAGMSDLDQAALEAATRSWEEASKAGDRAGMDAAHRQAEKLRAKYGYSGGSDGSQYLPEQQFSYESAPEYTGKYTKQIEDLLGTLQGRDPFSYDREAPTYNNRYDPQIQDLSQQILNREKFTYDPETDPQYASYRKEYAREGQRAAANALGQAAAMTGGMPSTAAIAASQQAGDYYASQMADKIPELYQAAYNMYMDEGNTMRNNLSMLQGLEQSDYNKYMTDLNQYNTDRSFALDAYNAQQARDQNLFGILQYLDTSDYNQYLNRLSQYNQDRNFAYNQFTDNRNYQYQQQRDQTADQQWQQQFDTQNQQWQQQFDRNVLESDRDFNYQQQRDQTADQQWADTFNRGIFESDRDFNYQQGRDTIADQQWQSQFDYQKERDTIGDQQWQSQLDYQKERDTIGDSQWQQEFDWQKYTDQAGIDLQRAAAARAASSGSRSSGGSRSSAGSGSGSGGEGDYDALFAAAQNSPSPQNFISSNYKKYGFSSSSGLNDLYKQWAANDWASFDYDPDEGIFSWNGKTYSSVSKLEDDINAAPMTPGQEAELKKKLSIWGFNS